jgi:Hpt domain.
MTLYQRFLKKFPADPTYASLCEAVKNGDAKPIEVAAHTMKGLAGNLGLGILFSLSTELLGEVRNGNDDAVAPLMEKLTAEYERVISYIGFL